MTQSIHEYMASIVPHGDKCYGCPRSDQHGIDGYTGDVFCHFFEEVMIDGNKDCGINVEQAEEIKNSVD